MWSPSWCINMYYILLCTCHCVVYLAVYICWCVGSSLCTCQCVLYLDVCMFQCVPHLAVYMCHSVLYLAVYVSMCTIFYCVHALLCTWVVVHIHIAMYTYYVTMLCTCYCISWVALYMCSSVHMLCNHVVYILLYKCCFVHVTVDFYHCVHVLLRACVTVHGCWISSYALT